MADASPVHCSCSENWKDDDQTFAISLLLRLPEPALLRILHNLRYHDLLALKHVIPDVSRLCDHEVAKIEKEFPSRPYYIFNRCAPSEKEEEMTERQKVCMTYSSRDASVYLFGGETIGNDFMESARATFNDLWRLNLVTMKWARVVIPTAPYPSPRCHASLVTWKNKLVLFGGYRAVPAGRGLEPTFIIESEVNIFDTDAHKWRYIPSDEGPSLAGHTAVVSNDLMIVYGGWEHNLRDVYERRIHIFNLQTEKWHFIELNKTKGNREFPRMDETRSKLVLIRDGFLLIAGEMMPGDYGSAIFVRYDPGDPLNSEWDWKAISSTGRWWNEKIVQGQRSASCSFPNYHFHSIAEVRNTSTVRLISLGSLRNDRISRAYYNEYYDDVQAKYREFCRELKCNLEAEFQRRSNNDDHTLGTCFIFSFRNIKCHIQNCFLPSSREANKAPRNYYAAHSIKVGVQFLNSQESSSKQMDEFDEWEVRSSIRATVNQMHAKYYNIGRMENLAARVPMRNGMLRRLSVYTAEISINADFREVEELKWIAQPQQYCAPIETDQYSLIGAHQEIIMHAGSVNFNQSMRRMGQTTLLVPARVILRPSAIDTPFLDIYR